MIDEKKDLIKEADVPVAAEEIPEEVGSIKIADEVLCIVAGLAVAEVPGVAAMSGGIVGGLTEMLGKKNFSKGIKAIPDGKTVRLEIYVIVEYGYTIPDVAIKIQEKVKEAVQNMAGFDVTGVDVFVEGVKRTKVSSMEDAQKALKPSIIQPSEQEDEHEHT